MIIKISLQLTERVLWTMEVRTEVGKDHPIQASSFLDFESGLFSSLIAALVDIAEAAGVWFLLVLVLVIDMEVV